MSWRTNGLVLKARDAGRLIGINRWIASRLLRGYETKYKSYFATCIHPGDCVWDIGANVGYYTRFFAERVGAKGKVLAFEPSPVNYRYLVEQCSALGNVALFQCGLGNADGKLHLKQGKDELGATSRVTESPSDGVVVEIRSGESLLADGTANVPQIIKIDVEGFEWEVLEGMAALLKQKHLRAIGVEVHFGILKERGMRGVPQQIESLLRDSGFSFTWPDTSHLFALRNV